MMIDIQSPPIKATNESAVREDRLLVALSIGVRRRILSLLVEADGTMCVFELVRCFDLEQATISHHLRVLIRAGLVYCDKDGTLTYYYVRHDVLAEAQNIIASITARRTYANH
jgi:ArsR family transcriptional regulator